MTHSETPKEADDTNDHDSAPMSETPLKDDRDESHIKSKSSVDTADGVRQRLKFDGEASGMTPDPRRSMETVKQGETRESNALLVSRLRGRRCDSCRILAMAAPQLSRWKTWLKTTGQMSMARDICSRDSICKVEPDLDTINTEAALERLLENGVVRDIPRAEGAGMKHLTTRWEKTWRKRNNKWEYKVRFVGREYRWQEFREDLFVLGASCCTGRIVDILSLKRRVPTFTLYCTDAHHQAPELDDVVVERPEEYLNRLRAAGSIISRLR